MSNCLANLDQSLEGLEIDCTALKKATCPKISLLKTPTLAGTCTCADSFEPPPSANRPFIDQTTSIETSATAGVVQRQQRPATATDAVKASSVLLVYYFVIFAIVVAMQNMAALKVVEQHQQQQRRFSQVAVYKEETSGKITSNAACGAAACEVIHPWTTASTCTCNGLLGYKQCGKENFTNETALKNKTDARPKFFNTAIKKNELCSDIETNEGIISFKAQTIEAKFRNLKQYSLTSLGKYINHVFCKIKLLEKNT